jgi:hypothetical protein
MAFWPNKKLAVIFHVQGVPFLLYGLFNGVAVI